MICRIYDVVDLKTGEILMKGSTISPLSKRFSKSPYTEPKHKNHKLFLSREWEWPDEDRDFGILEWQTSKACQTARIKSGKKAVNRLKILVPLSQPLAVAASHAKKNEEGKSIHAVEMGKKGIKYHSIEEKLAARRKSARDWATRHRRTHPPRSASEELA